MGKSGERATEQVDPEFVGDAATRAKITDPIGTTKEKGPPSSSVAQGNEDHAHLEAGGGVLGRDVIYSDSRQFSQWALSGRTPDSCPANT